MDTPAKMGEARAKDTALIVAIERYTDGWRWGASASGDAWEVFMRASLGIPEGRVVRLHPDDFERTELKKTIGRLSRITSADGRFWFVFVGLVREDERGRVFLLGPRGTRAVRSRHKVLAAKAELSLAELGGALGWSHEGPAILIDGALEEPKIGTNQRSPLPQLSLPKSKALGLAGIGARDDRDYPGTLMPVFSHALLGALRGWADRNHDGVVPLGEATGYVKGELSRFSILEESYRLSSWGPQNAVLTQGEEHEPNSVTRYREEPALFNPEGLVLPEIERLDHPPRDPSDFSYERSCIPHPPLNEPWSDCEVPPRGEILSFDEYFRECREGTATQIWADAWCSTSGDACASPWARKGLELCVNLTRHREQRRRVIHALAQDISHLEQLLEKSVDSPDHGAEALQSFWRRYPMLEALGLVQRIERVCRRVATNAQGTPRQPDQAWVAIPAGVLHRAPGFRYSTFSGINGSKEPESGPEDWLLLDGFELSRTEVTVAEYRRCVGAGLCSPVSAPPDAERVNFQEKGRQRNPVNYVTWFQAKAYCEWIGGRLPSEAEWEYAARSATQGWYFPWGNGLGEELSRTVRCPPSSYEEGCGRTDRNGTSPVCSRPSGNSAQGACDMLGNVWEWTADGAHRYYCGAPTDGSTWEGGEPGQHIMRGGSFRDDRQSTFERRAEPSQYQGADTGFRCVRD